MSEQSVTTIIPLDQIKIAENVRTHTGLEAQSIKELADSIKAVGLLQPLLVAAHENAYLVIAGQRRYLACKLLGLAAVPAIVQDRNTSGEDLKAIQIIENLQRENLSLAETCTAVRDMLAMVGKPAEVAKRLSKSAAWVSKHLAPTGPSFKPEIRSLINNGKLQDVETALMLNQIAKLPAGTAALDKLIGLASVERLSRGQVKTELERLKSPAEEDGDEPGDEGGESTPTGKQTITATLPANLAAIYEALGGEKWLKKELKKLAESQSELPV